MLDARPSRDRSGYSMGHRFLSFGRPLDAVGRRRKLAHALSAARRVGADHVVISGDLTEIGSPGEFETPRRGAARLGHRARAHHPRPRQPRPLHVARRLDPGAARAPWRPSRRRAPRSPGTSSSARVCASCRSTSRASSRSRGRPAGSRTTALDVVQRRAADPGLSDRPLLVVQHHPPFVRTTQPLHWLDGLIGAARLMCDPRGLPAPVRAARAPALGGEPRPRVRRGAGASARRPSSTTRTRRGCGSTTCATVSCRPRGWSAERSLRHDAARWLHEVAGRGKIGSRSPLFFRGSVLGPVAGVTCNH